MLEGARNPLFVCISLKMLKTVSETSVTYPAYQAPLLSYLLFILLHCMETLANGLRQTTPMSGKTGIVIAMANEDKKKNTEKNCFTVLPTPLAFS